MTIDVGSVVAGTPAVSAGPGHTATVDDTGQIIIDGAVPSAGQPGIATPGGTTISGRLGDSITLVLGPGGTPITGATTGGTGNPVIAGAGPITPTASTQTSTAWLRVRRTSVRVVFNGQDIPLNTILAVQCSYGWNQAVSTADVTVSTYPAGGGRPSNYLDPMQVYINGVLRWTGLLLDKDFSNWPRSIVLKGRSDLYLAEQYVNQAPDFPSDQLDPGIDLTTLLGGPDTGTLKQICLAVLTICGVDTSNASNWADPPHVYGLLAPEEFTWKWGVSGLAYLHSLMEASCGYRLFASGDGKTYLAQIIGRPRSGAPNLTLAQGIDILDGAKMTRSLAATRNSVMVIGWDDGSGFGPVHMPDVATLNFPNDLQPGPTLFTHTFSSSMIEDDAFAQELVDYWGLEVSREITTGSVPTWRDDVMGPAQSHLILSGFAQPNSIIPAPANEATNGGRLGTGEKGWVTALTIAINEKGEFTQTPTYVIGGLEASYTPPAV